MTSFNNRGIGEVFSLWSVNGLYSYESSREIISPVLEIGAAPVREIEIENGAKRESWIDRVWSPQSWWL
jgi:hypothetical protein